MIKKNRVKFSSWTALATLIAMTSGIGAANAGVVLTYTVNVTGVPQVPGPPRPGYTAPKFPETIKAWYAGTKARIEQVGGNITIYDTAAGQEYHINPAAKTYYIQNTNRGGGGGRGFGGPGGPGGPGGQGGFGGGGGGSTADLTKTSDTRTILSAPSTRYALTGSLSFGRRGGFGGSGSGGGGGGFTPPSFSGDVWFSSEVPLPASATSATPEASILALGMRPLARPLSDAVLKIGEIPLAGKVNLSITRPNFDGGDPTTINIVESFYAVSVRNGPINPALFTPPASFTKVDPPQRGGFGRGGGGGGGWGGRGGGGFGGGGGGGFGGGGQDNGGGPPPPDDNGDAPPPPDGGGN